MPIAVQVRRGDYVGHKGLDVTGESYFLNAMDWMKVYYANPHFFMVSDDPEWCQETFGSLEDLTVMPPQTALEGLATMVACEAHIISNSTFGWWGAWLGEDGPVVTPKVWHLKAIGEWEPVPKRWIRVGLGTDVENVSVSREPLDRAIVIPWHGDQSVWQELRYCLRSIDKYFKDRECPIIIMGTRRPPWLLFEESRVKFAQAFDYKSALVRGVQAAEKVLWMNDDIFLLKEVGWGDFETPRYLREVGPEFLEKAGEQKNPWRAGCLKVLGQLRDEGVTDQKVYSTHTPYLFERSKAAATLRRFGAWDKMPFELAYFNLWAESPELLGDWRATSAPFGDATCLNFSDRTLVMDLRKAVVERFPDYAPWELQAKFQV